MSGKKLRNLVILAYVVIGVVIAWDHHYIGSAWLRTFASALLAVIFWWLVPLGVNLHINP